MSDNNEKKEQLIKIDKNHEKLNTDVNKKTVDKQKLKENILTLAGSVAITLVIVSPYLFLLKYFHDNTKAYKKEQNRVDDCSIKEKHLHYYGFPNGLGTYLNTERVHPEEFKDIVRTSEVRYVTDEELSLYTYLQDNNLICANDNIDAINQILSINKDHTEYETYSTDVDLIPNIVYHGAGGAGEGFFPYVFVDDTNYWWSTDPNIDSKTGKIRDCDYKYYAYKVEKDESGNYSAIKSEPLEDFYQRPDGFDYINPEFYTVEYNELMLDNQENQKTR